jgi:hypothetical protein
MPEVENLIAAFPEPKSDPALVKALQDQAVAMARQADATTAMNVTLAQAAPSYTGNAQADRFERMVHAVLAGRLLTSIEDVLKWARELCDGIDREFPNAPPG